MMKIGSLFSGIGGLELGLEMAGVGHTVWQVEQSEFCRNVLARHWPWATRFADVRDVGAFNLEPVDLICGGFPCQDISSAGKGAGLSGERSGLWSEFYRVVDECQPFCVVVENVASGASRWVGSVCQLLAELGYETLPIPLSAQDVGAPHIRRRVFVVAYAQRNTVRDWAERQSARRPRRVQAEGQGKLVDYGQAGNATDTGCERLEKREGFPGDGWEELAPAQGIRGGRYAADADRNSESAVAIDEEVGRLQTVAGHGGWSRGPVVPPVCGMDDGIPNRMDRLRALGNAVVPQCAEVVGWVIRELMGAA